MNILAYPLPVYIFMLFCYFSPITYSQCLCLLLNENQSVLILPKDQFSGSGLSTLFDVLNF